MEGNLFPACGEDANGFMGIDYAMLLKSNRNKKKSNDNDGFDYAKSMKRHVIEKKANLEPLEVRAIEKQI
jgi:hypothetical protein